MADSEEQISSQFPSKTSSMASPPGDRISEEPLSQSRRSSKALSSAGSRSQSREGSKVDTCSESYKTGGTRSGDARSGDSKSVDIRSGDGRSGDARSGSTSSKYSVIEDSRSDATRRSSQQVGDLKSLPLRVQKNLAYGAKGSSCMSAIRKYLCVFVFLDLAVHSVLYILYLKHIDDFDLIDIIECQARCYDIQTSFIDILALAIGRFLILETFYGMFRSDSWAWTGLTTALTSVFIIVKPLHFDWELECQRIWPVSMMILSFTLAWLEAFIVDFRLISMENLADMFAEAKPETYRKDIPRVNLITAFFPITGGLLRSIVIRSDSMTLCHRRPD